MPILKDDQTKLASIKGKLASIVSELENVDSERALKFANWLLDKAKYEKQHQTGLPFSRFPSKISRGDIVRADFGINVGDEFSDDSTDMHFGLIWAQKGFLFIVIPLTKTRQPRSNEFGLDLGVIPGLPGTTDAIPQKTWAKLEGIRSVSIRRLRPLSEKPDGKVTASDAVLEKISKAFEDHFVLPKKEQVEDATVTAPIENPS